MHPALLYSAKPKLGVSLTAPMRTKKDLSLAYTPGIAEVCRAIAANPDSLPEYSFRRNNLAVISDGSAVLGLGNIGHKASYPVMEGKAMLFKKFANIDAIPIIIDTQDADEFVKTVVHIADSFAAINLEDISAPRCFEIEEKLLSLPLPLMHDDQHGTAIVVAAALANSLTLLAKDKSVRIVVSGCGAAGIGVTKLLLALGYESIVMVDSKGIVMHKREDMHVSKKQMAQLTNKNKLEGTLVDAMVGADVFLGLSSPGILSYNMVKSMNLKPIIIAMANPVPEIMPDIAKKAGATIVATGRSDFPNQVNNALAFPGVFRGAIDARAKITKEAKLAAVTAIVDYHKTKLGNRNLMPSILDVEVHKVVAKMVYNTLISQ